MMRRPPRSTLSSSSAASDVYKRQGYEYIMFRGYNLKQKEVVNIKTAERLGRISDVEISESTGNIEAIIVPRKGCCLARLFGGGELVIPWSAIEVVGEDLVLVRFFDIDNEKLS